MLNSTAHPTPRRTTHWLLLLILFTVLLSVAVSGCAPRGYVVRSQPQSAQAASPPPETTTVYFYPTHGQSKDQQDRDRYECYLWARKQTGFDPGQSHLAPHQRVEVTPAAPPAADTATGAFTGAMVGSMMSSGHDRGFGMIFGAMTGAMLGAASDQARAEQAQRMEDRYNSRDERQYVRLERQARRYQRAMTACLEGRGYTVR